MILEINPYVFLAVNGLFTGIGSFVGQYLAQKYLKNRINKIHNRAKRIIKKINDKIKQVKKK